MSFTRSFTFTRSRHSHPFPIYTTTQYFPPPTAVCDPNDPYSPCYSPTPCDPYDPYSPCYVPPPAVTYYQPPTQTTAVIQGTVQTVPSPGQGPDFALVAYPSVISLPPGNFAGSIEFTLNLTSVQGWTGTVDFTTSSLPPGITFSNIPSQFTLTSSVASWDVQVNIAPTTQAGSYSVLIVASSGTLAQSTSLTVEVA